MEVVDENAMRAEGSPPVSLLGSHFAHRGVVGEVHVSINVKLSTFPWETSHGSQSQQPTTERSSVAVAACIRPCTSVAYVALFPMSVRPLPLLPWVPRPPVCLRLEHARR